MTAGTVTGLIIGGILFINLFSALNKGKKEEVAEAKEPKPKKSKKALTQKECYGNACKQVNELHATIKKMKKQATTAHDQKLITNLESKILTLV